MNRICFKHAYYIKLGEGRKWAESSIAEGRMRIGWPAQTLHDINSGHWDKIYAQLLPTNKNKGAATRDFNALKDICESTAEDVWITFHQDKMWWARPGDPTIQQDELSKFREMQGWSDEDANGKKLMMHALPGRLTKTQAFRATACKVQEVETLRRMLNADISPEFAQIAAAREAMVEAVQKGLCELHWKDFETFVDLLFRQSGWRRLSVLGKTMKYRDMDLEDPITGDQYQVQVKSSAGLADFKRYASQFDDTEFRRLYFVVHTPDKSLASFENDREDVELILPARLAQMAVDLGLVGWVMDRVK